MSEVSSKLLATFDGLPANEQHELIVTMLRRSGEMPDTALSDEALVDIADQMFQALDAEEADGGVTGAR